MLAGFATRCRDAGYVGERWREPLQIGVNESGWVDPPVHARRATGDDALSLVVRLFAVGSAEPGRDVERVFGAVLTAGLESVGLLRRDETGLVASNFAVMPVENVLLVSDWPADAESATDVVTGLNPAGRMTRHLTIRPNGGRMLDLGTGFGMQALLGAADAESVVATDINARALDLAGCNAALNGIENISWRHGSWFDPVGDDDFDVIVANPPFIVSPDRSLLFRDGGDRDDVSRLVVAGAAQRLRRGGFAHVLCNWIVPPGAQPGEPAWAWAAGSGCDVLVIRLLSQDALDYAVDWCGHLRRQPGTFEATLDRWLAYYRDQDIERIDMGLVVLRRTGRAPFTATVDSLGRRPHHSCSEELLRMFAGHDVLARVGDDRDLLDLRLTLSSDVRVDQSLTRPAQRWVSHPAVLKVPDGTGTSVSMPARVLEALFALDGQLTIREAMGETWGEPGDAITGEVVKAVRDCLAHGLLECRDG